jgi:hypothetical protein
MAAAQSINSVKALGAFAIGIDRVIAMEVLKVEREPIGPVGRKVMARARGRRAPGQDCIANLGRQTVDMFRVPRRVMDFLGNSRE